MMSKLNTLQKTVRKIRGNRSLREVSQEIGISYSALCRLENGKDPTIKNFALLCRWLKTDPNKFLKCYLDHNHIKYILFTTLLFPTIATAQTYPFPSPFGLSFGQHAQPQVVVPMPMPVNPGTTSNGFAVIERERPLPIFQLDNENRTYHSYKVVPLDENGQLTQPVITNDEYITDLAWSLGRKK